MQKLQALGDLVARCGRRSPSRPASLILRAVSSERETGSAVKSAIDMPFTLTARLSGRSRFP